MGDISQWILVGTVWLAIYLGAKWIDTAHKKHESDLNRVREEINDLREILTAVAYDVERFACTPEEQGRRRFDRLPALLPESLASCNSGQELSLLLRTVIPERIIPVRYRHRELTYRSPDQKDAVAYGEAKLAEAAEFSEVRILFSRPNRTATLRGLAEEGNVKEGR